MALSMAVTKQWFDGKKVNIVGTITASGSYTTGGDTLNLQGIGIKSSQVPFLVQINGQNGFLYSWVAGTTQANGKVKVLVATTGGTNLPLSEHSAAAYVSGVTSDVITFEGMFEIR
jgi:hypothetical protein